MPPDEPTDEVGAEELNQDHDTPFRPADPTPSPTGNTTDPVVGARDSGLSDDHPQTDTNLQPEEWYDEDISGAAEVSDQSKESAVTGYEPPANTTQATAGNEDEEKTDTAA